MQNDVPKIIFTAGVRPYHFRLRKLCTIDPDTIGDVVSAVNELLKLPAKNLEGPITQTHMLFIQKKSDGSIGITLSGKFKKSDIKLILDYIQDIPPERFTTSLEDSVISSSGRKEILMLKTKQNMTPRAIADKLSLKRFQVIKVLEKILPLNAQKPA